MNIKLMKYMMVDILRSKMILGYTFLLLLMSFSVFTLEDNPSKGLLSMLNITLVIVPLVGGVFSSIYFYNSAEFIELLVSQPIARKTIWRSVFAGLSGALSIAYLIGAGLAIVLFAPGISGGMMILSGLFLTNTFIAIGLLATVKIRDKAPGIGIVILLWLYFALLFDGIVLFVTFQMAEYPMEKAMVLISALNPIDLCRILVLLQLDVSALLGYTGAIFTQYFGTSLGLLISFFVLLLWIIIPYQFARRWFIKKDL